MTWDTVAIATQWGRPLAFGTSSLDAKKRVVPLCRLGACLSQMCRGNTVLASAKCEDGRTVYAVQGWVGDIDTDAEPVLCILLSNVKGGEEVATRQDAHMTGLAVLDGLDAEHGSSLVLELAAMREENESNGDEYSFSSSIGQESAKALPSLVRFQDRVVQRFLRKESPTATILRPYFELALIVDTRFEAWTAVASICQTETLESNSMAHEAFWTACRGTSCTVLRELLPKKSWQALEKRGGELEQEKWEVLTMCHDDDVPFEIHAVRLGNLVLLAQTAGDGESGGVEALGEAALVVKQELDHLIYTPGLGAVGEREKLLGRNNSVQKMIRKLSSPRFESARRETHSSDQGKLTAIEPGIEENGDEAIDDGSPVEAFDPSKDIA